MKTNRLALFSAIILMGFLNSCEKKQDCKNCPNTFTPPEGTYTYSDEGRTNEMLNYKEVVAMLTEYDNTREAPLEKALGYKDTRINNINFEQFKKYLGHIENLSDSAKIKITGISFISGAIKNYDGKNRSYQDLLYVPTTTINGKQVAFDPVQSVKQGKFVTLDAMLAKYGYKWPYLNDKNTVKLKAKKMQQSAKSLDENPADSGLGNRATLTPPH